MYRDKKHQVFQEENLSRANSNTNAMKTLAIIINGGPKMTNTIATRGRTYVVYSKASGNAR